MVRRLIEFILPIGLVVCAGALPVVGSAQAGLKAERPEWKAGDKFTFVCTEGKRTYEQETAITLVDESSVKFTRNGIALENDRDGNPIKDEIATHSYAGAGHFLLEVGKTWTTNEKWDRTDAPWHGSAKNSAKVVAYEKVRVPAGEFDAFKVQWTSDWTSDTGGTGRNTGSFWWAPSARTAVKRIVHFEGAPELACDLKKYQLQP